jgi:hypothetical protein
MTEQTDITSIECNNSNNGNNNNNASTPSPQYLLSFYEQYQQLKQQIISTLDTQLHNEQLALKNKLSLIIENKLSKVNNTNNNNNNTTTTYKQIHPPLFDPQILPKCVCISPLNPNHLIYTRQPHLTQHTFAFSLCDINTEVSNAYTEFQYEIKRNTKWMFVGVCDRKLVIESKCVFTIGRGCKGVFGVSINGVTWNSNNKEENNKHISLLTRSIYLHEQQQLPTPYVVSFRYVNNTKELEYDCKGMFKGKLTKVFPHLTKYLTLCIVFINTGDEVELKLH